MSAFDPSASMLPETTLPAPSARATTIATAAMPTRMPNAVSAARTGRCRIAESASRTAVQRKPATLFMPQRLHRFDEGRAPRRQKSEDETHDEARRQRDEQSRSAELHRPAEGV